MPKVRKGAEERWVRRASVATDDYRAGIKDPRQPWEAATLAAKEAFRQGVQQALQRGAWEKGVSEAGDAEWEERATTLGAERYAQGVSASQDRYAERVRPYLEAIERMTLPPRGPKGDPRNLQRVQKIASTLHALKTKAG